MHYLSHFDAFFPLKINFMWKFCLKVWFFWNHLLHRLETCSIGFSMPQTLNTCHSSHFYAFLQLNINKIWYFGCFLILLTKHENLSIWTGKNASKRLANLHIWFLGIPITMHYVRTLCDKCFLSYYGFSAFFTGTSRYRVLQHGVGVEWD